MKTKDWDGGVVGSEDSMKVFYDNFDAMWRNDGPLSVGFIGWTLDWHFPVDPVFLLDLLAI